MKALSAEEAYVFLRKDPYLIVWVTPSGQVDSVKADLRLRKRQRFTRDLESMGCAWALAHITPYDGTQRCSNVQNNEGREILFLVLDGYANPESSAWTRFSDVKRSELVHDVGRAASMQRHPARGQRV